MDEPDSDAQVSAAGRIGYFIAKESGRPSSIIRFRMLQAINASVFLRSGMTSPRSPMIDLYLNNVFSTRACWGYPDSLKTQSVQAKKEPCPLHSCMIKSC